MKGLDQLQIIRAYCDYVEEHLRNVDTAWKILQEVLQHENVIYDDFLFSQIDEMIYSHDASKLSADEFIQYAEYFMGDKNKSTTSAFNAAWEHHKAHNPHHWENWTNAPESFPNEKSCHIVCMVADWMAMGMKFGDTAQEYYERKIDKTRLPPWSVDFLELIFTELDKYDQRMKETP